MQQQLFQLLFGKEEMDTDRDFLAAITERHPYFGAAHFYLLKKTQTGTTAFEKTAGKTALFFNDPFFLELQLQKDEKSTFVAAQEIPTTQHQEEPEPVAAHPEKIVVTETEAPLFEPLHASDYFASQGIKLSEDAMATDKLGMQLKSFTAWLKTMKKVHPDKMPAAGAAEIIIQTLAAKSNLEEEVLTEAMAEAFLQQGKHAKAIAIWSKLSLQNPSESAYFAAKIESLKQQ